MLDELYQIDKTAFYLWFKNRRPVKRKAPNPDHDRWATTAQGTVCSETRVKAEGLSSLDKRSALTACSACKPQERRLRALMHEPRLLLLNPHAVNPDSSPRRERGGRAAHAGHRASSSPRQAWGDWCTGVLPRDQPPEGPEARGAGRACSALWCRLKNWGKRKARRARRSSFHGNVKAKRSSRFSHAGTTTTTTTCATRRGARAHTCT